MSKNFIFHFRPRHIPAGALCFTLTWGLGGMAALMIMQQLLTGLLLNIFYQPLPVQAYQSVEHIQNTIFMGRLVRNMHHWIGHALIIVVFLHLLRVFLSGAIYPPRRTNWFVGLGLAVLVLLANFSGYLLPWDQLSYWAVTIATSMLSYIPLIGIPLQEMLLGGEEVGAATLQLFYFIHTGIVPASLFLLLIYHFWFIRKAGGVYLPNKETTPEMDKRKFVPVAPNLLVRELAFAAIVTCVLLLYSMLVDAPLGAMANPHVTPEAVKAPWYFMGAQELLLHVHPLVAVFFLPLGIGSFLVLLPFIKTKEEQPQGWLKAVFLIGIVFLLILTIVGIWFRGPGMRLMWPW